MFILMSAYKRLTDEQIIQSVMDYVAKFPKANRNNILKYTLGCHTRKRELEKEGKLMLPKAQPVGNAWRKFIIDKKPIVYAS